MAAETASTDLTTAHDDVVPILQELLRIDTSNDGTGRGPGEALAAEYVESSLREVGYDVERFTTTSGTRQGVVLRIPGTSGRPERLLLHGHLDVVPAEADDWQVPPFGAEVIDGMVWGRGAVDMKDMDAMLIALLRDWARTGYRPPRDLVVLFTPDEEAGGRHGAHWLVDERPDMFEGVTEAVGEVGGFSFTVREGLRLYLLQTAEKGLAWMRLTARGRAGHGSMLNDANAVTALASAVARLGAHRFPLHLTPTAQALFEELCEIYGLDARDVEGSLARLGPLARFVGSGAMNTANPTMLNAGYKVNVIPEVATAHVDGRFLPGQAEAFLAEVDDVLGPDITREILHGDVALEVPYAGPTIEAMKAALLAEDPQGRCVPYLMSGGTDAKAFSRLGIAGYGFVPLQLPPDLDFAALFHGVDERVPIDALHFGLRTLNRFLAAV